MNKTIVFDMDGTLIRNTDSVSLLCDLADADTTSIDAKEQAGEMSWIEADYEKAALLKGLELRRLRERFDEKVLIIENLQNLLASLKNKGFTTILMTAGPGQVAELVSEKFGFDIWAASDYEAIDGKFTGRILSHLGNEGKFHRLKAICDRLDADCAACIAVGDSWSDVPLFDNVRRSIALNPTPGIEKRATRALVTENIAELLEVILGFAETL